MCAQAFDRDMHAQVRAANHIGRRLLAPHRHTASRPEDREPPLGQEPQHKAHRLRPLQLHKKRTVHHSMRIARIRRLVLVLTWQEKKYKQNWSQKISFFCCFSCSTRTACAQEIRIQSGRVEHVIYRRLIILRLARNNFVVIFGYHSIQFL